MRSLREPDCFSAALQINCLRRVLCIQIMNSDSIKNFKSACKTNFFKIEGKNGFKIQNENNETENPYIITFANSLMQIEFEGINYGSNVAVSFKPINCIRSYSILNLIAEISGKQGIEEYYVSMPYTQEEQIYYHSQLIDKYRNWILKGRAVELINNINQRIERRLLRAKTIQEVKNRAKSIHNKSVK